jgi:GntR family transcriptional regulator/MocR family aminotransferase
MRSRYRMARDTVAEVLARTARGALRLSVPTQGLHMLAHLPAGTTRATARAIAGTAQVDVRLLSEARRSGKGPEAFILGFAGHAVPDLEDAAERLGRAAWSALASP